MLTVPPNNVTNPTAATAAPPVMPMTSGEASGLRIMPCNSAPDIPRAAPTSKDNNTRGSLSVSTTKSCSPAFRPRMVRITSSGEIKSLPRLVPTTCYQKQEDTSGDDQHGLAFHLHGDRVLLIPVRQHLPHIFVTPCGRYIRRRGRRLVLSLRPAELPAA